MRIEQELEGPGADSKFLWKLGLVGLVAMIASQRIEAFGSVARPATVSEGKYPLEVAIF